MDIDDLPMPDSEDLEPITSQSVSHPRQSLTMGSEDTKGLTPSQKRLILSACDQIPGHEPDRIKSISKITGYEINDLGQIFEAHPELDPTGFNGQTGLAPVNIHKAALKQEERFRDALQAIGLEAEESEQALNRSKLIRDCSADAFRMTTGGQVAMALRLEKAIQQDSELLEELLKQSPEDDPELEVMRQRYISTTRNAIRHNQTQYIEITKQTNASLIQMSLAQLKRDQLKAKQDENNERSKKPGFTAQ